MIILCREILNSVFFKLTFTVLPLLDILIAEITEILKREGRCDKKSTWSNPEWCSSYVTADRTGSTCSNIAKRDPSGIFIALRVALSIPPNLL